MTIATHAVAKTCRKLTDVLLAPLTWLERARGRRRLLLLVVYAIVLTIAGGLLWRATSLWGLPDIGEPFDVEAFQRNDVPDNENAFTFYEEAARKMVAPKKPMSGMPMSTFYYYYRGDWENLPAVVIAWRDANQGALALWKRGSERDRAHPRTTTSQEAYRTSELTSSIINFCQLAAIEASRLQASDDFPGAWDWCLASYRANRHLRENGQDSIYMAHWCQATIVLPAIQRWLLDPANRPKDIRKALADLIEARRLGGDGEETIKSLYVSIMKSVDWENRDEWLAKEREKQVYDYQLLLHEPDLRWFLIREPERTKRLLKIVFANWLAHRAVNPEAAPDVRAGSFSFWDLDERAPAKARVLSADEFLRWRDSCIVLDQIDKSIEMTNLDKLFSLMRDAQLALFAEVVKTLFEQEHGRGSKSADELMKAYSNEIPKDLHAGVRARIEFMEMKTAPPTAPTPAP